MRLVIAIIVLALGTISASTAHAADGAAAITRVMVGVTPGKPMELLDRKQPAEAIAVIAGQGRYRLEVHVNVARGGMRAPTTMNVEITAAEWEQIVALVARHSLATWKPEPGPGGVADFGSRLLRIEGGEANVQEWIQPPANAAGVQALTDHLAALAHRTLPDRLAYLRPADAADRPLEISRIVVGVTPPGEDRRADQRTAAETITVVRRPDGQHLELRRNQQGLPNEAKAVPLSDADLKALLALVAKHSLREWKPEGGKLDPSFGTRVLSLEPVNEQTWTHAPTNGAGVDALMTHLARLAAAGQPGYLQLLVPAKR